MNEEQEKEILNEAKIQTARHKKKIQIISLVAIIAVIEWLQWRVYLL